MPPPVYIPTASQYISRYSLLGTFAHELMEAFAAVGCIVNAPQHPRDQRGIFIFFNTPTHVEKLLAWVESTVGSLTNAALLHFFVDHPLALPSAQLDVLSKVPTYRLLLPCRDDAHLIRFRWPMLKHMTCPHGVPAAALCPTEPMAQDFLAPHTRGDRPIPLIIAGSIHTPEELAALRGAVPRELHSMCDAVIAMQVMHPSMPLTQAFDLTLPAGVVSADHWRLLTVVQQYTTAAVNRERRIALVQAMQGIPTMVLGPAAWEPFATGTIQYGAETAYADIPANLARARVCLAWGPTQFAHTFSERLLLAFASGCATVADDRLLTRMHFAESPETAACSIADFSNPPAAREAVEVLLDQPEVALEIAGRGRAAVEAGHLWSHRLDTFAAAATDCWRNSEGAA